MDSYQMSQLKRLQVIEDILIKAKSEPGTVISSVTPCSSTHGVSASITPYIKQPDRSIGLSNPTEVSYWLAFGRLRVTSAIISNLASDTHGGRAFGRSRKYTIRLFWLLRRDLQILFEHLHGTWRFTFRTYRIITTEDPIFQACTTNDLNLVKLLCSKGQASPFDVLTRAWTLLHVSLRTQRS